MVLAATCAALKSTCGFPTVAWPTVWLFAGFPNGPSSMFRDYNRNVSAYFTGGRDFAVSVAAGLKVHSALKNSTIKR